MSKVISGATAVIAAFMATAPSSSQAKLSENTGISSTSPAPAISDAAAEAIKAKAERPPRIAAGWDQIPWPAMHIECKTCPHTIPKVQASRPPDHLGRPQLPFSPRR
jgi:hypothetical protein